MINSCLYVISRFGTKNKGGVERVADLLVRSLCEKYTRVEILSEECVMPGFLKNGRLSLFLFPFFASIYLWFQRIRRRDFQTISNGYQAAFYPADVVIMHGSAAAYVQAMKGRTGRMLGMRVTGWMEVIAMRLAHKIICVSDDLFDYVTTVQGINTAKCEVAYNGVVTEYSDVSDTVRLRDGEPIRLGFAGRLEYGKGVGYLLALAKCLVNRTDICLKIAALGEVPADLENRAEVKIFRGISADDMPVFYSQIDIFILPTLFEGFELVTLEAIAAGVPVLGRRIGACGLLLKRSVPWVGVLPETAEELLKQLPNFSSKFRARLDSSVMRRYVLDNFSIVDFCKKIEETLKRD